MASGAPVFTFTPAPHELPYYDGLFQVADQSRSGSIGGKEAVSFMSLSKVPTETLRNIWTMVDNPKTNSLDRTKFHNAVRLIQLQQNGQRPQDPTLAVPPGVNMRPPMFEGVSGVAVPLPGAPGQQHQPPAQQQPSQQQRQMPPQQPPPQQHLQQPPMQQMQQQPLMQQQQQPPTEMQQQQQPSSMALTTQDPYVMFPHEQSRYEALFSQYEAKKDGYVYGPEAVALFSKSGAEKTQLREVWNMADDPVDNRLSKLEFAIAMHLIVCVTKKNLPVPPNLPSSLRALKDKERADNAGGGGPAQQQPMQQMQYGQQQMQQQAPPSPQAIQRETPSPSMQPMQQPAIQPNPSMGSGAGMGMVPPPQVSSSISIPSPTLGAQPTPAIQAPSSPMAGGLGPSMMGAYSVGMGSHGQAGGGGMSSLPGPPPITAHGGASISNAFEGLKPETASAGYNVPPSPAPDAAYGGGIATSRLYEEVKPKPASPAPPMPDISVRNESTSAAPTAPAPHSMPSGDGADFKKSYKMEDDNGELIKLKTTLQKLQAENISLRAKLGDVSEEEKEVRREINATVAEIGKLSQELTGLRDRVADAKAALIEATAELKAQKEKKGMINDLIDDANQTIDALESAHSGVEDLKATDEQIQQREAQKAAASNNFESDLFGGFDAAPPAPAAAPIPAEPHPEHKVPSSEPEQEPAHATVAAAAPAHTDTQKHDFSAVGHHAAEDGDHAGFMGGSAPVAHAPDVAPQTMQSAVAPMGGTAPSGGSTLNANAFGHSAPDVPNSLSTEAIEAMKEEVKQLDSKARQAEDSSRELLVRVDDLRREAEQAEVLAAEKLSAAEGQKKKRFGKGGKKIAMKEAENAKQQAATKKQAAAQAQTELNNAQAAAIKAKREADALRQRTEEAEMQAASAASVAMAAPEAPSAPAAHPQMDYGAYGVPAPPVPATSQVNGSDHGGFAVGAMGGIMLDKPVGDSGTSNGSAGMGVGIGMMGGTAGGMMGGGMSAGDDSGIGIPSPSNSVHGDEDYSNPFGGF